MTRKKALQLITKAVERVIQNELSYAADLYESGVASDSDFARLAYEKREELREALRVLSKPEKLLF